MKRVLALALLAVLTGGPSVKWLCHDSCTAEHPVAATEKCHNSSDSKPAVISGHACDHALPVALAAKLLTSDTLLLSFMQAASAAIAPAPNLVSLFLPVAVHSTSPPLLSLVIPLRI
jgi:hypothetical protein